MSDKLNLDSDTNHPTSSPAVHLAGDEVHIWSAVFEQSPHVVANFFPYFLRMKKLALHVFTSKKIRTSCKEAFLKAGSDGLTEPSINQVEITLELGDAARLISIAGDPIQGCGLVAEKFRGMITVHYFNKLINI